MAAVSPGASAPVCLSVSNRRNAHEGCGLVRGRRVRDDAPDLRPRLLLLGLQPGLHNVTSVLWAVCCWDKDVGR